MVETITYDIFTSYRTTYSNWVITLATNLEKLGYNIFLDQWNLIDGQSFPSQLHIALKNSHCAILIATPDTTESGWVQQELDLMLIRANSKDDFFFIPVVMGEFPDLPFIETIQTIDFGDSQPDIYRKAFYRLLCGLKQEPPGAKGTYTELLELPKPLSQPEQTLAISGQSFIDKIFNSLHYGVPIIILAQADTQTQAYSKALRKQAENLYGSDNVIHIYPPNSIRADSAAYFGRLAKQCHFSQPITESWEWADAMREKLEQGQNIFLLVTGFENGDETSRSELSGEIRQLHESFSNLHSVIFGGKKLAALKYANGSLSLLNIAEDFLIPSINQQDLEHIFSQRYPNLKIQADQLQTLMSFTGYHPRLLDYCLQQGVGTIGTAKQCLLNSPLPAQLFIRFREQLDKPRLLAFLNKKTLGKYEPWPVDKLLRRLYWNNLITRQGQNFIWRCDFIRETGLTLWKG